MRETERDLLEVVDEYLRRTGREIDERNRLNAIYGNPGWLKRWPAYKAAQKKAAMNAPRQKPTTKPEDQALVEQWLAMRNEQIRAYNESLTTGVGLPKLEIGYANFQITFEKALYEAREWFESRQQEYDDTVTAAGRARQQFLQAENERANKLLHQPIDPNDPIYLKYKIRLTPISDAQLDDYAKWPVADLQQAIDHVKYQAGLNINLNGALTEHEWACITRFVQTNGLDPMAQENYETAALILTEHNVIRRKALGPVTVYIEPPKLPTPVVRPVVETQPMSRAQEQLQRENELIAEIKMKFGEYATEISDNDSVPLENAVLFEAYRELMETRSELNRENVRRAIFYAILKIRGSRPAHSAFTNEEVDGFAEAGDMSDVSSEELKRQLTKWGDFKRSRMPNETNALLKQLVAQLGRKS